MMGLQLTAAQAKAVDAFRGKVGNWGVFAGCLWMMNKEGTSLAFIEPRYKDGSACASVRFDNAKFLGFPCEVNLNTGDVVRLPDELPIDVSTPLASTPENSLKRYRTPWNEKDMGADSPMGCIGVKTMKAAVRVFEVFGIRDFTGIYFGSFQYWQGTNADTRVAIVTMGFHQPEGKKHGK